ncbi:MAG: hypothetical protein ACFFCS_24495 [Candidatus Hodarchaeota archaeon]
MSDLIIICGIEDVLCPDILENKDVTDSREKARWAVSNIFHYPWIKKKSEIFSRAEHVYFVTKREPWLIDVSIVWIYKHVPWLDFFEIIHLDFENPDQKYPDKVKKIETICESYKDADLVLIDNDPSIIEHFQQKYPAITSILIDNGKIVS